MYPTMIRSLFLLGLTCLLMAPGIARAGKCNITSTPISFGTYDPFSATTTSGTGTINVRCNPPKETFLVTIQVNTGNSGTFSQRNMLSASGDELLYNIFSSPGGMSVIGDGNSGSISLTQQVDRTTPWNLTLFGIIPAGQNVAPGVYTDTLTATILW